MADQITKSVRRIVKGMKDDPFGLGAAEDYKGIGTSRGEAYINSRGGVTGSGSSGSSEDKDEQPTSGTPSTGDPISNTTGGSGGGTGGTGGVIVGSVSGDVADVDAAITTDSKVGDLTGTDPTTGNYSSLNINTLEGIEYIPPTGGTCEKGIFVASYSSLYISATNSTGTTITTTAGNKVVVTKVSGSWLPNPEQPPRYGNWVHTVESPTSHRFWITDYPYTDNSGGLYIDVKEYKQDDGGADTFCFGDESDGTYGFNETNPDNEVGSCDIVYDQAAGGYKGSDSNQFCSTSQKTASDFIIIRSASDPSKYFRYTKLANGGTKITQVDSGGVPVPGTITKTTDEGGQVDGFYDVSLDASIK